MAKSVENAMRSQGVCVFLDRNSIASGSVWRRELLRALSECARVVVILDEATPTSPWILAESAYAALLRKRVGKPKILLVVRNESALRQLRAGPFGAVYRDFFELPPERRFGIGVLTTGGTSLRAAEIESAFSQIRSMQLLP